MTHVLDTVAELFVCRLCDAIAGRLLSLEDAHVGSVEQRNVTSPNLDSYAPNITSAPQLDLEQITDEEIEMLADEIFEDIIGTESSGQELPLITVEI